MKREVKTIVVRRKQIDEDKLALAFLLLAKALHEKRQEAGSGVHLREDDGDGEAEAA